MLLTGIENISNIALIEMFKIYLISLFKYSAKKPKRRLVAHQPIGCNLSHLFVQTYVCYSGKIWMRGRRWRAASMGDNSLKYFSPDADTNLNRSTGVDPDLLGTLAAERVGELVMDGDDHSR